MPTPENRAGLTVDNVKDHNGIEEKEDTDISVRSAPLALRTALLKISSWQMETDFLANMRRRAMMYWELGLWENALEIEHSIWEITLRMLKI
jgi:hypothetical protein